VIRNDEHWLSLVDSLHSAAIGERGWNAALEGLAGATGSRRFRTPKRSRASLAPAVPLSSRWCFDSSCRMLAFD
jgi:hypothetical protein